MDFQSGNKLGITDIDGDEEKETSDTISKSGTFVAENNVLRINSGLQKINGKFSVLDFGYNYLLLGKTEK